MSEALEVLRFGQHDINIETSNDVGLRLKLLESEFEGESVGRAKQALVRGIEFDTHMLPKLAETKPEYGSMIGGYGVLDESNYVDLSKVYAAKYRNAFASGFPKQTPKERTEELWEMRMPGQWLKRLGKSRCPLLSTKIQSSFPATNTQRRCS